MESISLQNLRIVEDQLRQILDAIHKLELWNADLTDVNELVSSPDGMKTLAADCMLTPLRAHLISFLNELKYPPHTLHPNWRCALCACGFDVGVHLSKVYTHPTPYLNARFEFALTRIIVCAYAHDDLRIRKRSQERHLFPVRAAFNPCGNAFYTL